MVAMRPLTTPSARLAALAGHQHGVVSRAQLHEMGFDDPAIARLIRGRRLHRLYRGVYAVGHTVVNRHGRWLAATMATGGVLSHRSAAALWGIRPTTAARIDVAASHTSGVRSTERIIVHRSRRPIQATTLERIPVTNPGQTLADLALALPRRALEKAAEMAEALRLHVHVDPDHPGAQRLAAVLDGHDLSATTRSELEDAFLALCDRYGISRPLVNSVQEGVEVDFCWPAERLIVETDGHRHHGTRAAFEHDRARDALLTAAGWRVMRFTHRQVLGDPGAVAGRVLSARSRSLATLGSPSP